MGVPEEPQILAYGSPQPSWMWHSNGPAILAMVFGLASLGLGFFSCLAMLLAFVSLAVGLPTLSQFRRMRISAIWMASIGIAGGGIVVVVWTVVMDRAWTFVGPPTLAPKGFQSKTYHLEPKLSTEETKSLQIQGIYASGHLHSLQVITVDSMSLLSTGYGLRPGDVITSYNSHPISDVDDLESAKARVIAAARSSAKYKVLRNGRGLFLTNGHPPVEAAPDK